MNELGICRLAIRGVLSASVNNWELGMDEFSLGRELGMLAARVAALEAALASKGHDCGCSKQTGGKADGHVEMLGMARRTDQEADPSIVMRPDNGPYGIDAECADGHLRRITYNGVCYCQMCCGGGWKYFCYSNGQCIQCPGRVTVNCNGNNWMLSC